VHVVKPKHGDAPVDDADDPVDNLLVSKHIFAQLGLLDLI
jgi:hypothetical protein